MVRLVRPVKLVMLVRLVRLWPDNFQSTLTCILKRLLAIFAKEADHLKYGIAWPDHSSLY